MNLCICDKNKNLTSWHSHWYVIMILHACHVIMEYSHSKLDPKADLQFCFVGFDALRPNSFSVMSGQLLVVLG